MIFPMALLVLPIFILEIEPWLLTQARPVSDIWNFFYQSWEIDVLYTPEVLKLEGYDAGVARGHIPL